MADLPEEAELYRVPPEEFVAARDELARRLRDGGDRERAAEVKRLRRPSQAAWLVNATAAERPELLEELLAAGEELRAAQAAALGSREGGERLREAAADERRLVAELVAVARGIAERGGRRAGAPVLDKVAATLQAAGVDDELRAELAEGRVARERSEATLGMLGVAPPPAPSGEEDDGGAQEEEAQERRLREDRARLERELERSRSEETRAADAVSRAEERLEGARATLKDAKAAARRQAAETKRLERDLRGLG